MRMATAREATELRLLIETLLDDDAERAEALRIALADVESALTCFRALVGTDNADDPRMRRCLECSAYSVTTGRCRQAAHGVPLGFRVSRIYRPVFPERPHRCAGFLPVLKASR
jgi:hypothetical protein